MTQTDIKNSLGISTKWRCVKYKRKSKFNLQQKTDICFVIKIDKVDITFFILKKNGVEIFILNDEYSITMMNNFINLQPELWDEDIQKYE